MRYLVVFLFTLLPNLLRAQLFINRSKDNVRQELEKQKSRYDSTRVGLFETDSTIIFGIKDPTSLGGLAIFVYYFNEKGKCIAERTIAYCDSCFKKYLGKVLTRKEFKWTKLNAHTYISSFTKRVMLEMGQGKDKLSFVIRKMNWTFISYRTLQRSVETAGR
jgi:hypothetical protein